MGSHRHEVDLTDDGRELLRRCHDDLPFDPATVEIDDSDVLARLEPEVREWWVETFGEFVPGNGGFFTPPQKEAIPLVDDGENTLVCAPTGSGKCVKPDTPLIVEQHGEVRTVRAQELYQQRGQKIGDIDGGELFESDSSVFAYQDGEVTTSSAQVYSESYQGPLYRFQTTYGRDVEVTPAHPLLVESEDGPEWRPAEEVSEGDRVGVPRELQLPERKITLDSDRAIERLRSEFDIVLTAEESSDVIQALEKADSIGQLDEEQLRAATALADVSMRAIADRISASIATVHGQITGSTETKESRTRELLLDGMEPLDANEVVVKTTNGRVSRFHYPETLSADLARLSAFILAEGQIGGDERSRYVMISQKWQSDLLEDVRRSMEELFGVEFEPAHEIDYYVSDTVFATFLSELVGIDIGTGREVPFPDWLLNAPRHLKSVFLETFLSLEAEVRESEIVLTQANEMKIEQLNYLLLSFGVLCSRSEVQKTATNTPEQNEHEYHRLTIRGRDDLRRVLAETDIAHPKMSELEAYAEGGRRGGAKVGKYQFDYERIAELSDYFEDYDAFMAELGNVYEVVRRSGYITEEALSKLRTTLRDLPDDQTVAELSADIREVQSRNVAWLTVEEKSTEPYGGRIIDLSVPGPHNFVGGRGAMYLHNTQASFAAIYNDLFRRAKADDLGNSVYCLYISPLKSLANDIHRNLAEPIDAITDKLAANGHEDVDLRHAIRHGDTSDSDRQAMLSTTPHILNTTPETLAILLNSPKFKRKLETVEYVIVDEIHSLADNKRGTHMAVSLERLETMAEGSPTRIGCSATVEPLSGMAEFLVGCETPADAGPADAAPVGSTPSAAPDVDAGAVESGPPDGRSGADRDPTVRDYEIVDARFVRDFDIELHCPTDDLIDTPPGIVNERFYDRLHEWIGDATNTLVFTNTRSGAERVLHNLRENYPGYDESNSGCHHGSLSKEERERVEELLKTGDVDVVTTSTSLELGIDMPHIDLVVQVGSPKSVAALLQRVGRAGHQLGETVTGRVVALDRDELVECAVMLRKAEAGFVDRVFVPEDAKDVAAQQVYGMAINGPRPEREIREILRRAYPYRNFSDAEFERLFRYLTADYDGLEERNVYAKIWRDTNDAPGGEHHYEEFDPGRPLIGKRGRMARVIYMTNIGTIPDSFTCDVFTRSGDEWVGQLDEEYLDTLETGDVFVLGGSNYEYRYRRGSKVYADPTGARPTVPSWFSERLPLSYDLGREILAFQRELLAELVDGGPPAVREWLREFPLDEHSVRAVTRMFDEQVRYAGADSVATDGRLVVEEELDREQYERHYYVHSNYGRRFNDGFSRLLAYRCAQEANANVQVAVADHGFTLSMPLNRKVDLPGVLESIPPGQARADLRDALDGTDLLKRYFRINATRALLILKRYKGYEKSAAQQQVSSEMLLSFAEELTDFSVIEETYREILEDKLNLAGIEAVLRELQRGGLEVVHHTVETPTPRAFGLATLMASDVVLAEDESAVLQEFHQRVLEEIDDEADGDGALAEGGD